MRTRHLFAAAFAAALALCASAAPKADVCEFWVSAKGDDRSPGTKAKPVQTLARAVELTRGVARECAKTIVVRDGFYSVEKPVRVGPTDYDLVIRAENPGKAVFSGAVRIEKWAADASDPRFLVADLPFKPGDGDRHVLLCGGKWADLAKFPEKGRLKYLSNNSQVNLVYDAKSLPEGTDFSGIDLASAWLQIPQEWATTRTGIKEHDAASSTFVLKSKTNMPLGNYNQGFLLMNTRHGLTRPGTWMFEATAGRIVYWPREGETAETLVATITRSESILDIQGSSGVKVSGLVFEGCAQIAANSNMWAARAANAPVSAKNSRNVVIEDVEVRDTAANGIFMLKPVECVVRRCHVHGVGSSGVNFLDGGSHSGVEKSEIHDFGRMDASANGIGLQLVRAYCVGTKIYDGPGNGITLWDNVGGSLIAGNEIHHVMKVQRDGGGLYGGYVDSVVRDNYVHDIWWAGLYADEGSQRDLFTGNRFENCPWPTHMHQTQHIVVSNNVMRHSGAMRFSFQGSGHGVFCDNKIYTDKPITTDAYLANCDFWGRNEVFVRHGDGEYKSVGKVTLERPRSKVATMKADNLSAEPLKPLDGRGKLNNVFKTKWNEAGFTDAGEDGHPSVGVPNAMVKVAYDQCYLYFGFWRRYNALSGYFGMRNFTSGGWCHCDAVRLAFAGGRTVTVFPDGSFKCEGERPITLVKEDVGVAEAGKVVFVRVPLECLDIPGAKKGVVDLEGDGGDDMVLDDMLNVDVGKAGSGKARRIVEVAGCSVRFNAMIWVEDLRELKAVSLVDAKDPATGTIVFKK